jgi:fatty-acid desaturase
MSRWPVDPSWIVIRAMEAVGLVWDVVRVDPEKMARKAVAEAA